MINTKATEAVHHGENIKLARSIRMVSQEDLAMQLNMSSSKLSRIESQEVVEDDMLKNISLALDVPFAFFKEYSNDKFLKSFTQNMDNFNVQDSATGSIGVGHDNISNYNYSPEQIKDMKDIYERFLKKLEDEVAFLKEDRERKIASIEELKEKIVKLEVRLENK